MNRDNEVVNRNVYLYFELSEKDTLCTGSTETLRHSVRFQSRENRISSLPLLGSAGGSDTIPEALRRTNAESSVLVCQ